MAYCFHIPLSLRCLPRWLRPCRAAWSFPGFPNTRREPLHEEYCFLGAKPSETSIAFVRKLVSNCIPLHAGCLWRRLFRWFNALFTTWLDSRDAHGKAFSTLVLLWERLGPGAATNELWIPSQHDHVIIDLPWGWRLPRLPRERLQDFQ